MSYFIRRMLLVPLTFVCITGIVYTVMRLAPGGPIEQAKLRAQAAAAAEGGGGGMAEGEDLALPEEAIEKLRKYYKLDRWIPAGYAIWLGVWPDRDREGKFSGILQGDFGTSYRYSDPVLDTIFSKFPISVYFGLIGFMIVGWFTGGFAPSLEYGIAIGAVVLFSGFVLYDTSQILHHYRTDEYVAGALSLYIDFILLFQYILMLLGRRD